MDNCNHFLTMIRNCSPSSCMLIFTCVMLRPSDGMILPASRLYIYVGSIITISTLTINCWAPLPLHHVLMLLPFFPNY